jgi:hypothetical protein
MTLVRSREVPEAADNHVVQYIAQLIDIILKSIIRIMFLMEPKTFANWCCEVAGSMALTMRV